MRLSGTYIPTVPSPLTVLSYLIDFIDKLF